VLYQVLKNGPLTTPNITNSLKISYLTQCGYLTNVVIGNETGYYASTPTGALAFRTYMGSADVATALVKFADSELPTTSA